MDNPRGYESLPFSANRRMIAAAAAVNREQNTVHGIIEIDITEPRRLFREHRIRTGETLSFTAFIVASLAKVVVENPFLNSFRKGRKLIVLDDVTISVLIEREIEGQNVPEPLGIRSAQTKSYRQIHDEIRAAQNEPADELGTLSGTPWIRFIPGFMLRTFIRAASRSVRMSKRFGKVGVTAVGMFGHGALWFVPLSGATMAVTVGSIFGRPVLKEGRVEPREFLCLTLSFNHDIVDGAPAARVAKRLAELIENGDVIRETVGAANV